MLGAAAQGKFEAVLVPFAAAAGPARKRVNAACEHLAALRHMVRARVHEQADQTVWSIMQQSIARAIEYDMRLCPWQFLEEHAARLETECWHVLEPLMGASMDSHAREQASLPGWLGGLSLALPSKLRAAAAFHAAEAARRGAVARLAALLGLPTAGSAADAEAADEAAENLRLAGLSVRQGAAPALRLWPAIATWRGPGRRTSQRRQSSPSRTRQRRALGPSGVAGVRCPVLVTRRLLGRRPARASTGESCAASTR